MLRAKTVKPKRFRTQMGFFKNKCTTVGKMMRSCGQKSSVPQKEMVSSPKIYIASADIPPFPSFICSSLMVVSFPHGHPQSWEISCYFKYYDSLLYASTCEAPYSSSPSPTSSSLSPPLHHSSPCLFSTRATTLNLKSAPPLSLSNSITLPIPCRTPLSLNTSSSSPNAPLSSG